MAPTPPLQIACAEPQDGVMALGRSVSSTNHPRHRDVVAPLRLGGGYPATSTHRQHDPASRRVRIRLVGLAPECQISHNERNLAECVAGISEIFTPCFAVWAVFIRSSAFSNPGCNIVVIPPQRTAQS